MIWVGGFGWGTSLPGLVITAVLFAVNLFGLYLVVRQLRSHRKPGGGDGETGQPRRPSPRGWSGAWPDDGEWADEEVSQARPKSDALRILEERYARGEIDRDEFLRRRDDLRDS